MPHRLSHALAASLMLLIGLWDAASARAEVYTWVDERGTFHMSESLDDVPPRYRSQVRSVDGSRVHVTDDASSSDASQPHPEPRGEARSEQPPQSRSWGGLSASEWQMRFMDVVRMERGLERCVAEIGRGDWAFEPGTLALHDDRRFERVWHCGPHCIFDLGTVEGAEIERLCREQSRDVAREAYRDAVRSARAKLEEEARAADVPDEIISGEGVASFLGSSSGSRRLTSPSADDPRRKEREAEFEALTVSWGRCEDDLRSIDACFTTIPYPCDELLGEARVSMLQAALAGLCARASEDDDLPVLLASPSCGGVPNGSLHTWQSALQMIHEELYCSYQREKKRMSEFRMGMR